MNTIFGVVNSSGFEDWLVLTLNPTLTQVVSSNIQINSASIFPEIIGVVALAGLSLCALGFCISTFAKNIREAQRYLSPIFIVFFLPIYVAFLLPPSQLSTYASIPLLGYTLLIRDIILGTASAGEIALSLTVNAATLLFLLWLGIRLLSSEKVILRSG